MTSDIDIARAAQLEPIDAVASRLAIPADALAPYGRYKAKIQPDFIRTLSDNRDGALTLVSAVSPTPAGEGKTTTTIGLGDALNRIGKRAVVCLREPSLGPCFGMKGGATGGGYAQVAPMEDINLHFTGDFPAITAAHNLLAAMIDNHIYWGNALAIDRRKIVWRRVMDMNDRALRQIVTALGGNSNGLPAETGFDITVASEVMAILCLAEDVHDLERRLSRIIVAYDANGKAVTAQDLEASGAMTALLKDAIAPNIVQTLENNPAFVHGGPFANIAHGCNSVIATRTALKLADYVVTEAGFGADLGAEKFFNIKCRKAGLRPRAAVIVATVRSLKMNGGTARDHLAQEDMAALTRGCANLGRHIENLHQFGVPVIVAVNHFADDTAREFETVRDYAAGRGAKAVSCRHWAEGSKGAEELAREVVALADGSGAQFAPLYDDGLALIDKIETVAKRIYRADRIVAEPKILAQLKKWEAEGFASLPVCMAKTQYSFSTDPTLLGAPQGHSVQLREVRLCAGAGFVVAICGDIMTMPGLPKRPAATRIGIDADGRIVGLS